jgi:hypothetical protein
MDGVSFGSLMQAPVAGIRRGVERMQAAGEVLAEEVDPAAMVQLKLGQREVEVGAKVAAILDETLGSLIDTLA